MLEGDFPTTAEWLMLLRNKENNCTDYHLAKVLGVSQNAIIHLLRKGGVMSDTTAVKVAELLGFSPVLLILSVSKERLKSESFNDELEKLPSELFKASCYILTGFLLSSLYHVPSLFSVI